jgi:phosphotransacetylase
MNFDKIIEKAKSGEMKSVVVAAAQDSHVLAAVSEAAAIGLVKPILVGNEDEIKKIIAEHSFKLQDAQIVHADNDQMSAEVAVKMVSDKKADVLMKGLLGTATLLKAVLNKEWGLRTGNLLSHVGIIESKESADKLYFLTDGAMVMYPDLNQKVGLINNAVQVVRSFGIEVPKVACIAAVEVVNPDMPATLDAAALTMMNQRGQIHHGFRVQLRVNAQIFVVLQSIAHRIGNTADTDLNRRTVRNFFQNKRCHFFIQRRGFFCQQLRYRLLFFDNIVYLTHVNFDIFRIHFRHLRIYLYNHQPHFFQKSHAPTGPQPK